MDVNKDQLVLTNAQQVVVSELSIMFPTIPLRTLEETSIEYDGNLEVCVDVLLSSSLSKTGVTPANTNNNNNNLNNNNDQSSSSSVGNDNDEIEIVDYESDEEQQQQGQQQSQQQQQTDNWKIDQLLDAFPQLSRKELEDTLIKFNGNFAEAASALFDKIASPTTASTTTTTENNSNNKVLKSSGTINKNNKQDDEVFVVCNEKTGFDWSQDPTIVGQHKALLIARETMDDHLIAQKLQQQEKEEQDKLLKQQQEQQQQIKQKNKKRLPGSYIYEPARISKDDKLRDFFTDEAAEMRKINSQIKQFKLPLYLNMHEIVNLVKAHFVRCNKRVQRMEKVVREDHLQRFYERVFTGQLKTVLCYHGTNPINFPSIVASGLKVPYPGSGITVAHGSSFGYGIFVATKPQGALGYTCGSDKMLVCMAAYGNSFVSTNNGLTLVITDNALVVPLFIAQYRYHNFGYYNY